MHKFVKTAYTSYRHGLSAFVTNRTLKAFPKMLGGAKWGAGETEWDVSETRRDLSRTSDRASITVP